MKLALQLTAEPQFCPEQDQEYVLGLPTPVLNADPAPIAQLGPVSGEVTAPLIPHDQLTGGGGGGGGGVLLIVTYVSQKLLQAIAIVFPF